MKNVATIAGIAVASVALALGLSRLGRAPVPRAPLELAPGGSSVVVHLDVPAVLASPLWEAIAGGDPGLERVREACGFDPLAQLRTADVFVLGTSRRPLDQVAFVARGDLDPEALVACVEHVVEEGGGGVHTTEIEGEPALASDHGPSRAAFLAPDAVVAGDETIVREIVRIAHGTARAERDDASLSRLWSRVAVREEIVAVARVPERWRGALERAAMRLEGMEPLADLVTVALGARVRRGLGATLVLELEGAGDARALEGALRERIEALRRDPLVRLSTIGGALRRVDLEAQERDLVVTADLDEEELAAVVALAREALDRFLAEDEDRVPAAARPRAPIAPPAPDERFGPAGAGEGGRLGPAESPASSAPPAEPSGVAP